MAGRWWFANRDKMIQETALACCFCRQNSRLQQGMWACETTYHLKSYSNLSFTLSSMPITAQIHQVPSKHFHITLNSFQFFYYFLQRGASSLVTMCLVKWDFKKTLIYDMCFQMSRCHNKLSRFHDNLLPRIYQALQYSTIFQSNATIGQVSCLKLTT
jgi:hypothetical protein